MTCNQCEQEFNDSLETCPKCGRTLVHGAAAPTIASEVTPVGYAIPLSGLDENPSIGAGPTLGTTMSVTGSSSIRARMRPRSIGEIFSEAFRLYRQNWKLYCGIVLLFYLPCELLSLPFHRVPHLSAMAHHFNAAGVFRPLLPLLLLAYVAGFLAYSAVIRAVSEHYLGRSVRFSDVVKPTTRFWGMLGANTLMVLSFVVAFIVVFIGGCIFAGVLSACLRTTLKMEWLAAAAVIALAPVLALMVCWILATPAAIIEGCGARSALKRSVALVQGFGWRALAIVLGVLAIQWTVSLSLGKILGAFLAPMVGAHSSGWLGLPASAGFGAIAANGVINLVSSVIALPMMLLPVVLFYYDLRVRKEAFDLQMLAEQLGYGYQEI